MKSIIHVLSCGIKVAAGMLKYLFALGYARQKRGSARLAADLILALSAASLPAAAQEAPASLPVYEVIKTGATASEASALATRLGIHSKSLVLPGGAIAFVDPARYLSFSKLSEEEREKVRTSRLAGRAIEATRNKDGKRKITPAILNARALSEFKVVPEESVRAKAATALSEAGLMPEWGEISVGHHELSLYSKDGEKSIIQNNLPIDTEVAYKFTDPNGYPIYGPGAQAQITYDASGNVSRVLYAARKLKAGDRVQVIPPEEAEKQIAPLFAPKSTIKLRLVYFAPPLSNATDKPGVTTLIPWYAYYATMHITNPKTGAVSEVKSKIGFIPATHDPRFVPSVSVEASGRSQVHASATVRGGRPPYRYIWGGSNFAGSQNGESSITYTPQIRAAESLLRDPHFSLHREERLSVTVLDANGILVYATASVPVELTPVFPKSHGVSRPTYGSENPGDPLHWVPGEVAWNKEMGTPGGGATLSFDWPGDSAWPGDFIRPAPAATLVGTPWVFGDADFANWGVDTADIVLDNADGWSDGKAAMFPGAAATNYNSSNGATLSTPVSNTNVQIANQGYTVSYNGSWGPVGPNDTLEWLLLDDCDMLDPLDGSGLNVAQRWGPAFGGLHVLTGFASLDYGNGPFEGGVADNILGVNGATAQTIVQSWFNSAAANGAGTAAAMGPALEILPGIYICDSDDYFWGKGPVGPTLVPGSFPTGSIAYWYLTSTTPVQYLF